MPSIRAFSVLAAVVAASSLVISPLQPADAAAPKYVSAAALLSRLHVAQPDRSHKYKRAAFNYDDEWDADQDGCYTRKEVLIRDATHIDHVSKSCAVYGTWTSPYDNKTTNNPYTLEVDHLVPLAEAWHAGAWAWSAKKRTAFGNDLDYKWDLQAVTASLNQDKGNGDVSSWLPPKNRCTYIAAWIGVKTRWNLTIDPAEKATLTRWINKCNSPTVLNPGTPNIAKLSAGGPLKH